MSLKWTITNRKANRPQGSAVSHTQPHPTTKFPTCIIISDTTHWLYILDGGSSALCIVLKRSASHTEFTDH